MLIKNIRFFAIILFASLQYLLFIHNAFASDIFKPLHPKKEVAWQFDGVFGKFDRASIRRGYKVYKEVCAACHSLNRIAFRNLTEIGFSTKEAEALAAGYNIIDGPNDIGEMFDRPGALADHFVKPYPNSEAARASNHGALPPDLSLIIKARHDGANYVYSLLTGYKGTEPDSGGLYENPYFITGKLAMTPPLADGIVSYDDKTPQTLSNYAYDVVNFLQWTASPEMEHRKKIGYKVFIVLIVLFIFCVIAKKKVWDDAGK
ncbi:MAG: cytochrome c1 [Anaplasmataceae bacterium]|nr:cytochrome c1 [Anaplasmataceae bacterium]